MVREGWGWCTPERVPVDGTTVTWGEQEVLWVGRPEPQGHPTANLLSRGAGRCPSRRGYRSGRWAQGWVLPVMPMEMDRCWRDTCARVHVHGGGPAARISRPLNQHSTSDRKEIGFADGRSGTCFVHITEHQENVKFT